MTAVTHGSWVTWVMGQELNGSLGSWVTLSDPFPALSCSVQRCVLCCPVVVCGSSGGSLRCGLRWSAVFRPTRPTCIWWMTTYVRKPFPTRQPTRPTQPFILSRSINEYAVIGRALPRSTSCRLLNAYREKAWCGWLGFWGGGARDGRSRGSNLR